jgi:hypothetical protein
MSRVVLLGDSILDNAPYTAPHPDTTAHLSRILGPGWDAERLAQDGATMGGMRSQLERLDGRADIAVLSIGGNDVTAHIGMLDQPASRSSEVLRDLSVIHDAFTASYEMVAGAVADRAERVILCTIYEVRLEPEPYAELARIPLAVLNDQIVRIGARLGFDVLELRAVCTDPSDFCPTDRTVRARRRKNRQRDRGRRHRSRPSASAPDLRRGLSAG